MKLLLQCVRVEEFYHLWFTTYQPTGEYPVIEVEVEDIGQAIVYLEEEHPDLRLLSYEIL